MQGCSRNPGAPLSPGVLSKAHAGVCVPVCAHTHVCLSVCVCAFSGVAGRITLARALTHDGPHQ